MTPRERIEQKEARIAELKAQYTPPKKSKNPKRRRIKHLNKKNRIKYPTPKVHNPSKKPIPKSKGIKYDGKNHTVYLILCWKGREKFLKVGMTTKTVEQRFRNIPYNWKMLSKSDVTPELLRKYEQAVHSELRKFKYRPSVKFDGYTECFTIEAKEIALRYV